MQANAVYANDRYAVSTVRTANNGMTTMMWAKLAVSVALIALPLFIFMLALA